VLFGNLSKDIVIAGLPLPAHQKALLGRMAQLLILITAVVIGADQIGINVTFLVILAAVITAAFLGGVALALSLGSRHYVGNLIGAHHVRQAYRIGERVKLGEYEGRIVDFTPIAILLETEQGRVNLPASYFIEQPSTLYMGQQDNE
jgi:small-conductance mechanosensitive channel